MSKISNMNLTGLQVAVLGKVIEFDDRGIAEIESEEVYNLLTTMPGYVPTEETAADAPTEQAPAPEPPVEDTPVVEEAPAVEAVPAVEEAPAPKATAAKKK